MRNRLGSILWGLLIIAVGGIFLGNAMDWWNISVFFSGWWTLFIIIPSLVSMVQTGVNAGNLFGIGVGILLFLSDNDIITSKAIWPLVIIGGGVAVLFPAIFGKHSAASLTNLSPGSKTYHAIFTGINVRSDHELFEGATLNTTFGGIDMDLRNATIEKDIVIKASCIFGGIDLFLPANVKAQVGGTHIFGGVDNTFCSSSDENTPLVYIDATCIFGGMEIK